MCNECEMPDHLCDCSLFKERIINHGDLLEARRFAMAILSEEKDPSDTNTAIKLAEKIEKATRYLKR